MSVSNGWELSKIIDGDPCWLLKPLSEMLRCAAGDAPYFLRTGHGSGKHDWDKCCYVSDPSRTPNHVVNLVEWSCIADLPHDVWVVRELLPVKPILICPRYGNLPIAREWRYFINNGELLYGTPYWPRGALLKGAVEIDDETYCRIIEDPGEVAAKHARTISECIDGAWSVDVMLSGSQWYVIDMARAEDSWGWDESKIVI